MPAQIKLGNTPDIQTVGAVNAGTAIVPDASNSLFLADGSNRVAATSEFYSGPTQPLGNVKMWFDTTTGQLKVNDGKSWTVQKGHVQAKDHGSFDPPPVWLDITDIAYWDPRPMGDPYSEVNGTFINGEWVDTRDWNELWFATVGSWVLNGDDSWTWPEDRVVTPEEYTTMDYWWKGLRFSKIRIFFEVANPDYVPTDNYDLRLEVYNNCYEDLLFVALNATPRANTVVETPISGKEYDVVWPTNYSGFMADFGGIDMWGGKGVHKITKIEILLS